MWRNKKKAETRMVEELLGRMTPEIWDESPKEGRPDAYLMALYAEQADNDAASQGYLERAVGEGNQAACWTLAIDLLGEKPVLHHARALSLVKKSIDVIDSDQWDTITEIAKAFADDGHEAEASEWFELVKKHASK
jgi:hypothetical protein